jgi:hypothetical protein
MAERDVDEQVLHDHIIKILHKEQYGYPSNTHPRLMTYVNHPSRTKAVFTVEHEELVPDIVVVDTQHDRVMVVAEVETESTVNPEEEKEWAAFRRLNSRLHLYFPKGCGAQVMQLCRGYKNTELIQYSKQGDKYILEKLATLD